MTPTKTPLCDDEPLRRMADQVAASNGRRVGRYDHIANAIVGGLLGFLGALALLHFLTPCEAGTLCMAAVITPTRSGWRQTLWRWQRALRARYLRVRIAAVEIDIAHAEMALDTLPQQIALHKEQMLHWALDLASAELDARAS